MLQCHAVQAANFKDDQPTAGIEFSVPKLEACFVKQSGDKKYYLHCHDAPVNRLSSKQFAVLRSMDEQLQKNNTIGNQFKSGVLLEVFARTGDDNALAYIHEVFESAPERRNAAVMALSYYAQERKLRDADWRLMVRSLNVVEGEQAGHVIRALRRYRRRANKAQWVRQLIRVGLQLDNQNQKDAAELLQYWTSSRVEANAGTQQELLNWQRWFAEKYPEELPAELPIDAKNSQHKYAELREYLTKHRDDKIDLKLGKAAFTKAKCFKCHSVGTTGEKIGPQMTDIYNRMQEKEILLAIMFPSQFVPEEYPTSSVSTRSGKTYTGMLGAADVQTLLIVQLNGKKEFIKKVDVEKIISNKKSAMPVGLLNLLTREEISALFAYLRANSTGKVTPFHKAS